jgi:toxin ParE1/3/4
MRYHVKYHDEVEHDLLDIFSLIENYAGSQTARRKIAEFEETFAKLADFPQIGSLRNELVPRLRAIPVGEKGVICFIVNDDDRSVLVVSATYAGANWASRVKARDE